MWVLSAFLYFNFEIVIFYVPITRLKNKINIKKTTVQTQRIFLHLSLIAS